MKNKSETTLLVSVDKLCNTYITYIIIHKGLLVGKIKSCIPQAL